MSLYTDYQKAIFGPFFGQIFLTFGVWVLLAIRRVTFLKTSKIPPEQLMRPGEMARISPAPVTNVSDNFKNLFEVPVLFYAFTIYLFVTKQVDTTYVLGAWLFVAARVAHSFVHCTVNHILTRFYCFLASCVFLYLMIFRAALAHFF